MPEFRKICDVVQGYNYKKDKQTAVGYLTKIKIGDKDLAVDQTCKNPVTPTEDLKCVAVLSDVLWETGVTDAVYISGQISVYNKQDVALLVLTDMTKVDVVFQFTVFSYDPVAKVYYKAFHSNDTDMNGILEKNGESLNMSVAEDPSTQVQSPENYAFQIGIKPQPSAQSLHISTSSTKNVVKSWGLTVGG